MATNLVQIYNLALGAVGTRSLISFPDEKSREAAICNLWFPVVQPAVLRAAPWASTRAAARLALIATADDSRPWTPGDPEPGWQYSYKLPADFLYPRYLSDWSRFVLGQATVDQSGSRIETTTLMSNATDAVLVYTRKQDVVPLWDADLATALVYGLAAAISMPLHGKSTRASLAIQQANEAIMRARVATANEDVNQYESMPDWLAARGVGVGPPIERYIYPVGPLLTSAFLGAQADAAPAA